MSQEVKSDYLQYMERYASQMEMIGVLKQLEPGGKISLKQLDTLKRNAIYLAKCINKLEMDIEDQKLTTRTLIHNKNLEIMSLKDKLYEI